MERGSFPERGESMKSREKRAWVFYFGFWILAAAVFVVTGLWATETKRRIYTVEDRASYDRPAAYALYGYPDDLITCLRLADVVVRVRVAEEGKKGNTGTSYILRVDEVLMGSMNQEEISLFCWGNGRPGCPQLSRNDDLVLFLSEADGMYIPVTDAAGMFGVQQDGTLFSFSGREAFLSLDGKPILALYQAILSAAENIRANPEEYAETTDPGELLPQILDPESGILDRLEELVQAG